MSDTNNTNSFPEGVQKFIETTLNCPGSDKYGNDKKKHVGDMLDTVNAIMLIIFN